MRCHGRLGHRRWHRGPQARQDRCEALPSYGTPLRTGLCGRVRVGGSTRPCIWRSQCRALRITRAHPPISLDAPRPLLPPRKSPNPSVPFAMATSRRISLTAALLLCARSGSAFGVLDVCALEARSIDPATAACWRWGEGRRRRRRGRWRRWRWRRMRRGDHPAGSHDVPD
jgi:hypothetical protein